MTRRVSKARTKQELIIAVWDDLGRVMVGASELGRIQTAIREQFGAGAVASPTSIARVLADEGAELRHPEVIEFDARWREAEIKSSPERFAGPDGGARRKPLRPKGAEAFIQRLERVRDRAARAGDKAALRRIRDKAVKAREGAESLAKDRTLDETIRAEQSEIAKWLAVWI
ncbi:MAG: hypothetical protein ACMG6H_10985, partial [Acidobacteriota bacterium]